MKIRPMVLACRPARSAVTRIAAHVESDEDQEQQQQRPVLSTVAHLAPGMPTS